MEFSHWRNAIFPRERRSAPAEGTRPCSARIEIAEIFPQRRTVQRTTERNIQSCRLFRTAWTCHICRRFRYSGAVLVSPPFPDVRGTGPAEGAAGERRLMRAVKGHTALGPVDYGDGDKGQRVLSEDRGRMILHSFQYFRSRISTTSAAAPSPAWETMVNPSSRMAGMQLAGAKPRAAARSMEMSLPSSPMQ